MVDAYINVMTTIGVFVGMCVVAATYTIYIEMWSDIRQELKDYLKTIKQKRKNK